MTGPEHYREAEKLVRRAEDYDTEGAARAYAAAQVHATLALAAATALNDNVNEQGEGGLPLHDMHAWRAVASVNGTKS